jgi:type IX secretion system PorP/SprF family membrane protein
MAVFYASLSVLSAQQLPLFAQHAEYHGLINPASVNCNFLTDNGANLSVGLSYRSQWSGLGRVAPTTQVLRGEFINDNYNFIAGGYLQNDRLGITNNFGGYGRFAYVISGDNLSDGGLSFGLNLGVSRWDLKTSLLSLSQSNDPDFPEDPTFSYLDVGIGAYWYQKLGDESKYFYMGVSAPRTFSWGGKDYTSAKRYPHFYGLAGVYLPLFEDGFVEFSTWTRYVEKIPLQSSFNVRLQPTAFFWLGAGTITDFKTASYMMAECGVTHRGVKLGYAFSWSGVSQHFGNAHEVNLALVLDTR